MLEILFVTCHNANSKVLYTASVLGRWNEAKSWFVFFFKPACQFLRSIFVCFGPNSIDLVQSKASHTWVSFYGILLLLDTLLESVLKGR